MEVPLPPRERPVDLVGVAGLLQKVMLRFVQSLVDMVLRDFLPEPVHEAHLACIDMDISMGYLCELANVLLVGVASTVHPGLDDIVQLRPEELMERLLTGHIEVRRVVRVHPHTQWRADVWRVLERLKRDPQSS